MAKIFHSFDTSIPPHQSWEERWEGPDRGLICSWARGVEKARETSQLREQALRGELPPLVWKGGADTLADQSVDLAQASYTAGSRHPPVRTAWRRASAGG